MAEITGQSGWVQYMPALVERGPSQVLPAAGAGPAPAAGGSGLLPSPLPSNPAAALAANPDPPPGCKRSKLARGGHNVAVDLRDHAAEVLRILEDLDVLFDTTRPERDLRTPELHHTITDGFRAWSGAKASARVRSYTETVRKHSHNTYEALAGLFAARPWALPAT